MMRCRVGLEPDEAGPPDREGPVPDPCKIRERGIRKGACDICYWRQQSLMTEWVCTCSHLSGYFLSFSQLNNNVNQYNISRLNKGEKFIARF